ncbi:copper binding protein [Methanocella paludicola SANAE]|uniref:Copper binding protein n=1 Tax=Methanocella paludicola (strain DSM 17711 / JCM 13418 / NBRC 101707 / SANAE) TaxID=304371 RepID=D1Z2J1_METPS|nr:plastocyanin/azurin family copper-binding protein [Methanocella paludicola]BAI62913.1 copper binding protein [Methanocella paludicola SANAE]
MKIDWIHVIILVLAITAISGCSTPGPVVTPTAVPATPTPFPPTPTATSTVVPTPSPTSTTPSSASVTISGFSFQPGEVTIARGGTVTWTNNDGTAHTIKFQDSESPALQNGKTYSKTFNVTGTFDYICGIHTYMNGKVIVV